MRFSFVVRGKPVAWQRAGKTPKGRSYTQPESAAYRATVAWSARNAMPARWPMDARYRLCVQFFGAHGNVDSSNMLKQIEDAGNRICWNDDRQIDDTRAIRCHGGEPRVEVVVEVIAP